MGVYICTICGYVKSWKRMCGTKVCKDCYERHPPKDKKSQVKGEK
jgi:hypothetical protein